MLLPLFLEEIADGDWDDVWDEAWKRIHETFRSGRWNPAIRKINQAYGPLDPMYDEHGRDVWQVWKSEVVSRRGDIVHGKPSEEAEVTVKEAEVAIEWTHQMMGQLVMRLVAAGKHPLHDLVVAALEAARSDTLSEDGTAFSTPEQSALQDVTPPSRVENSGRKSAPAQENGL
jgi:hypothetical protein